MGLGLSSLYRATRVRVTHEKKLGLGLSSPYSTTDVRVTHGKIRARIRVSVKVTFTELRDDPRRDPPT